MLHKSDTMISKEVCTNAINRLARPITKADEKIYNANYNYYLPERTVIKAKAKMAPANTVNLG